VAILEEQELKIRDSLADNHKDNKSAVTVAESILLHQL